MAVKRSPVNYDLLICCMMAPDCVDSQVMHLSVSSWRGKGHREGISSIALSGGRAFELSCCPGARDI